MSYVWGLIDTDGHINSDKNIISITNKDLGFVKHIKRILNDNNISTNKIHQMVSKVYTISIRRKGQNILFKLKPKKLNDDYIAGIIDGDGSLSSYYDKTNKENRILFRLECSKIRKKKLFDKVKEYLSLNYKIDLIFNKFMRKNKLNYRYSLNKESSIIKLSKLLNHLCLIKREKMISILSS